MTDSENKVRKCIKGFDSELKCLGFQYEVGKRYELPEGKHVEICENGFHAIDEDENPLEVFYYYPPCNENGNPNRYCEVEIGGETEKGGSKIVGSEIRIVREIGIEGVVKAYKKWLTQHPEVKVSEENAEYSVASNTGNYSVASNTGNYSIASNTGNRSVASNTGNFSVASNTGDYSVASNTAYGSLASNTGNRSVASNTGNFSVALNTGDASVAVNNGVNSIAINNGFTSSASVEGEYSVAVAAAGGCVKGSLGCAIVAVERGEWNGKCYPILSGAFAIVDGVKIKADTWYKCKKGKFVKC